MKYPVQIRIKGYTYRIEYVQTQREVDESFESGSYLGSCISGQGGDDYTIRVLATQPMIGVWDTLLHEILHAILLKNKALQALIVEGKEEAFVDALSTEVAYFLIDNCFISQMKPPPITTRINPEAKP